MDRLCIGLIGGGFIGRVHATAFQMVKGFFADKVKDVTFKLIADKDDYSAQKAASRVGIDDWTDDWHTLVEDENINLVVVAVPNFLHKELALEIINQHKNIFCEKPLALNAEDAKQLYEAARKAGIVHGINFNYRKTPAVLLVKSWVKEGFLGSILSFRISFTQDWALDSDIPLDWHFQKKFAGSGVLGDLGSHAIDMARFLVGEIKEVTGRLSTHIEERPLVDFPAQGSPKTGKVDVDDICNVLLEFDNGAQGNMLASRVAQGRKNHFEFELYGTGGSVLFDWEQPNEVHFCSTSMRKGQNGFTKILVGGEDHPYGNTISPMAGMGTGFYEPFVIQLFEMIDAILNHRSMQPNFYDGWKANQAIDAIIESAKTHRWHSIA